MRVTGMPNPNLGVTLGVPVTPSMDQPKTNRAYPLKVRTPGPALPGFSGGARNAAKQVDSHPVFGHVGRTSPQRVDLSQDERLQPGA